MDDKIAPFAELLGKVPDERIAEMAGVDVADVQAAREPAPAAPAAAPKVPKVPKVPKGKKPANPKAATAVEPAPAPAHAPAAEGAPKALRVKVGLRIPNVHGGDRFVPRSIYRGAVAAKLWNDPQVPREALEVLER